MRRSIPARAGEPEGDDKTNVDTRGLSPPVRGSRPWP